MASVEVEPGPVSLNREERDAVVGALAGLLLEAADFAVKEDDDERL